MLTLFFHVLLSLLSRVLAEELQALWLSKQGEYTAGTRLLAALMTGDAAAVQAAIVAAGDVIRRGVPILGTCELPLCRAARSGNVEALRALLAAGAPVDAKDSNGRTALQVRRDGITCRITGLGWLQEYGDGTALLPQWIFLSSSQDFWAGFWARSFCIACGKYPPSPSAGVTHV